jgi:hypothetical protein
MSTRMSPVSGSPQRKSETDTKNPNAITTAAEAQSSESIMQDDIARLAYALWQGRGCPEGSAETDWLEAERELRRSAEPRRLSVTHS